VLFGDGEGERVGGRQEEFMYAGKTSRYLHPMVLRRIITSKRLTTCKIYISRARSNLFESEACLIQELSFYSFLPIFGSHISNEECSCAVPSHRTPLHAQLKP
jgi:hypothetical protein